MWLRKKHLLVVTDALHALLDRVGALEAIEAPEVDLSGILDRLAGVEAHQRSTVDLAVIEETQSRMQEALDSIRDRLATTVEAVDELEDYRKDLTIAVAAGIERVDRSERRIKATVKRARLQLADAGVEDSGLEAEHTQLSLVDGDGGEVEGMPTVPASVEDDAARPSSVAGVSVAQLRAARRL